MGSNRRIHGFRLLDNSWAENFHVERISNDPVITFPGRIWYNTTEDKMKISIIDNGSIKVIDIPIYQNKSINLGNVSGLIEIDLSLNYQIVRMNVTGLSTFKFKNSTTDLSDEKIITLIVTGGSNLDFSSENIAFEGEEFPVLSETGPDYITFIGNSENGWAGFLNGINVKRPLTAVFAETPTFEEYFTTLDLDTWFYDNEVSFSGNDTMFMGSNISVVNNNLRLELNSTPVNDKNYSGASLKSINFYGYGKYEVSMKPIDACGLISSFFLFQDGIDLSQYWNEIDIEFVCWQDIRKIQFNHWNTPGVTNEQSILEPFDLRSDFNKYTIHYTPNFIRWYINDTLYRTVTENLPTNPMRIMMNVWRPISYNEGVSNWAGNINDNMLPAYSLYDYIKFYPLI